MHDLVVRNGLVVDGTGRERFTADIAVDSGIIVEVGRDLGAGRREINADGHLVTPGFVDIHTHYDGQATWDAELAPSSWHGVTSVLMGNCGVGFAPVAPDMHDFLINVMEGVEDIPGTALAEGLPWDWESFPEYLDALESRKHTIDFGVQFPHVPLRAYVMRERGADPDIEPTDEELAEMSRLAEEGLRAGAMGFATSRVKGHRTKDGDYLGTRTASRRELLGIGGALKRAQTGVFQMVSDFLTSSNYELEFDLMRTLAAECGRPLSVTLLQTVADPGRWKKILNLLEDAAADGLDMKAQVAARAPGILIGLQGSSNPFMLTETYKRIEHLSLSERVQALREPETRERILVEYRHGVGMMLGANPIAAPDLARVFPLGDPPEYEPAPDQSIAARAERSGIDPADLLYDFLLEKDGREFLYVAAANYHAFNLDVAREMVLSERSVFGLSDGGAHVGAICDASFPTYNVYHWGRDRSRGEQLPLELVIKRQTRDTAFHVGWKDRGVIAPGYKADLNVIDFDQLQLEPPYMVHDLPAGGRRLLQKARGYKYTVCSGEVTFEDGHHTGALPGRLVRGAQAQR